MRTRFTWIVAVVALLSIGFLVACSAKYSASVNGLIVVPTQANKVMETFSLDLANGGVAQIYNQNGPPTGGIPGSVILDPAGAFSYVIINQNPGEQPSSTGIMSFPIASDGKLGSGTITAMNPTSPTVNAPCVTKTGATVPAAVQPTPVAPVAMAIDSAGKFMFVADAATSGQTQPYTCNGSSTTATVAVPGTVSVFSLSNGALTEIAGSPFALPIEPDGQTASASALAVTPTTYPNEYAVCAQQTAITTENLYVTDSVNYVVMNFSIDMSTGTPTLVPTATTPAVATGTDPSGVAVDPCNRFVYVANSQPSNTVSAYTICSTVSPTQDCPQADFSLHPVPGSPYPVGDAPGPLSVDAYGNFLYVVDTGSSQISAFRISDSTGALATLATPTYSIGSVAGANSIAIRSDDSFLFVANGNAQTVSEFGIVPASGSLTAEAPISTYNYPSGVAVK